MLPSASGATKGVGSRPRFVPAPLGGRVCTPSLEGPGDHPTISVGDSFGRRAFQHRDGPKIRGGQPQGPQNGHGGGTAPPSPAYAKRPPPPRIDRPAPSIPRTSF